MGFRWLVWTWRSIRMVLRGSGNHGKEVVSDPRKFRTPSPRAVGADRRANSCHAGLSGEW